MTCSGCEGRIERKLKGTNGVADAEASYSDGTLKLTWDENTVGIADISGLLSGLGYTLEAEKAGEKGKKGKRPDLLMAIWIAIALYEVYALMDRFGLLDMFRAFPTAKAGMEYGALFTLGLLTSVHCIAMCGGINMSQSLQTAPAALKGAALRSGFLYNLGRVASYTAIGGVVGALGSVVGVSAEAGGWVQIAAGAFMVLMGLNMLNVLPSLRRFTPRLPKSLADKIHGSTGRGPLYVGLLNGFMPCGPLQAMQLYALSTESFVGGAAAMFAFSVGTVPLMFLLSAASAVITRKFARGMMTVGATMVMLFGVAMLGSGASLAGFGGGVGQPSADLGGAIASVNGSVQNVRTELHSGRYDPIVVTAGIPVRWNIHAEPDALNGCNNSIIIPKFGRLRKDLNPGDNIIEFTPTTSGTFLYTCWMGMIRGRITVVDGAVVDGTGASTAAFAQSAEDEAEITAIAMEAGDGVDIFAEPEESGDSEAAGLFTARCPCCRERRRQ
jgi:sulfite exporter TauE/SafE/copper chaperone CopZ